MRKPLKLDRIPQVTKDCRDIGIYTDCNIIIGMPGETKQDIAESREFLKSIYADWFRVFVATPIPGRNARKRYCTTITTRFHRSGELQAGRH